MLDKEVPFMAYLEIAPHNQSKKKQNDYVAGCLIAYACRLSLTKGKSHFKGWLTFEVYEETDEGQIRSMSLYTKKYLAKKIGDNAMIITPTDGETLIEEYLKRKS